MGIHAERKKPKQSSAALSAPHILLAEDDREMRALLAGALRRAGYGVTECGDGVELLELLGSFILPDLEHVAVDLVISDIRMPGLTGLEILEGLSRHGDFPPFILITAFGDVETHARAKYSGALAMFDKPFDVDDLVAKVRKVVPLSS
jgi:DNA-binding response OmpR family regulator